MSTKNNAKKSVEEVTATLDKPSNRKPSWKQQKALGIMVENGGNASRAMIEAGYSPATAKNPDKLTASPTFQALLDEYLPERHLAEKHREFLDSKRIIRTYVKGDLKETTEETDGNAVKALDIAYKLRGKYQDKVGNNVLIVNISKEVADRYKDHP